MRVDPSRWTLAAVLLLVGANMVIDPDNFATLSHTFTSGIRNFERHVYGPLWRLRQRQPLDIPPVSRTAVRAAGTIAIALGLLAAIA